MTNVLTANINSKLNLNERRWSCS